MKEELKLVTMLYTKTKEIDVNLSLLLPFQNDLRVQLILIELTIYVFVSPNFNSEPNHLQNGGQFQFNSISILLFLHCLQRGNNLI